MVRISGRDMNQEIIASSHVKDAPDLRQFDDIRPKRIHQVPRVLSEANRDHRFETNAESRWIDVGVVAPDHPEPGKASYPFETGRRRDSDRLGKPVVSRASILLQNPQDGEVDSVKLV